jgi:hypothetical protein
MDGDRKLSVNDEDDDKENSAAIKIISLCLPMINQKRRVLVSREALFGGRDVCVYPSSYWDNFSYFYSISHRVDVHGKRNERGRKGNKLNYFPFVTP